MRARPRRMSIAGLLPNMLTVGALCAGVTAIRFGVEGHFRTALVLILLAAIMDGLDGRLARILRSESAIGAELDSLCDVVNFGVVPGLVLYLWGLQGEASLGWIAVLLYAICCMLRLARFNVGSRNEQPVEKSSFIGVPSPAGAMLALMPIYLEQVGLFRMPAMLVALWMVAVGVLMISRVRTPSLKRVRIKASYAPFALVCAAGAVAAVITYPWVMLLGFALVYLAALAWVGLRRLGR